VLWDRDLEKLQQAIKSFDPAFRDRISVREVDVTDPSTGSVGAEAIARDHGKLDVLVNNAGLTLAAGEERFKRYFDPFESYPLDLWDLALQVNLTGTFIVTQSLAPLLLKSGNASIINIASDVGVISPDHRIYKPVPEHGYAGVGFNSPLSYATSKAGLIHMTKYWATYWAKSGIRVNALSPAGVAKGYDAGFVRELTDRIPLGRMALPHEYKGAIVFLASDASSFMTGANLIIDGGRTAW
jgi:NAD(P)-dependent dehydrogenase (short-subunit alcohol dehydrogenase family)